MLLTRVAFFISFAALISCSDKGGEEDDSSAGSTQPATTVVPGGGGSPSPAAPAGDVTPTPAPTGSTAFYLNRYPLSPEQISNAIYRAVGFRLGYTDNQGNFHDMIIETYAVPLGGVDFLSALERDTRTQVNTLLIVRRIAWQVASGVVWRETRDDPGAPPKEVIVFTKVEMSTDRPYIASVDDARSESEKNNIRAGEARWLEQLQDLYLRILSRMPTDAEVAMMREAFSDVVLTEQWPPNAWTTVLYALFSSAEFWNQ